jgi:hypothetical protein
LGAVGDAQPCPRRIPRRCTSGRGPGSARLGLAQYTDAIFMKLQDPADVELVLNGISPKIAINRPTLEEAFILTLQKIGKSPNFKLINALDQSN